MSTVTITCSCGKMLRAKAADAGKKCKCVGCGKVLTIPAAAPAVVAAVPVAKPALMSSAKTTTAKPSSVAKTVSKSVTLNKTAPKTVPADADLDPAPLDDLLADLAIGPVDPPPVLELPELKELTSAPASRRSKPIAMIKSTAEAAPSVGETLASRAVLANRSRPEATGRGGSCHINWKIPAIGLALFLIVATVLFVKYGPAKAAAEWTKAQEEGENVVESVVTKALQAHLAISGAWDPGDSHYRPSVKSVAWFDFPIMMRMPDKVEVHGETTHGKYQGFYYTRTGELDVDHEGMIKLHITGRIDKDGKVIAEVGGKAVEVPAIVPRDRQDYR